jgi:polyisoprenoid-binding protein YceI
MKTKNTLLLALAFSLATFFSFAFVFAGWSIDPAYSIHYKTKNVEGTFSGLIGDIDFNPEDLPHARMAVAVQAATIKTGNSKKDQHAKSDSWFDVEKYPAIRFNSTSITRAGASGYLVAGTLELHGVSKNLSIPFQYVPKGTGAEFTGTFSINRKDYGIKGNMFGFMVGDVVDIELRVPVRP